VKRLFLIALMSGAPVFLGALPVCAAGLDAYQRADLVRGMKTVGLSSSEASAVRQEEKVGEPAPSFLVGTALAAWISARAQVEFDAKAPEAAGPPHNSQSGDTDDYVHQDCAEESIAFTALAARSRSLALEPEAVLAAAGLTDPALPAAWRAQTLGPAAICH